MSLARAVSSPSNSSKPSTKRHIFTESCALWHRFQNPSPSSLPVQFGSFDAPSSHDCQRHGLTALADAGICYNSSKSNDRRSPVRDFWMSVPGFQKKEPAVTNILGSAQPCRYSFVCGLSYKYLVRVDFPEPAFPFTQYRHLVPSPLVNHLTKFAHGTPLLKSRFKTQSKVAR